MTKLRASSKIAIGFAAIAAIGFSGYRYANYYLLGREHFPPLIPGEVNIVGLDRSAGYGILIENGVAKLRIGGGGKFQAPQDEKGLQGGDESERKFIPIKDMLKALQGKVDGLSYFVERLNDITDDQIPPDAPVWKMEDIDKALKGDKVLRTKLVRDLNMNLDGAPLAQVLPSALFNGIVVDVPIPFSIQLAAERKTIDARVKRPYRAAFITRVENSVSSKFATKETIAKEYAAIAQQLKAGEILKEDIPQSLQRFKGDLGQFAEMPQKILNSITPVINENQIVGARSESQETSKGTSYTLIITLSDEGRKRLWQFSRSRVGDQLLLTVRGVAIAAPLIDHELASGEVRVSGLTDDSLVQDAVATINEKRATTTK